MAIEDNAHGKSELERQRDKQEADLQEEEKEVVFEEGFTMKTVIGAFFVGFIMMPGSIYLGLLVGGNLGPAAQWVTIVLFNEIARRSFLPLKRQEIYILYYVAGSLAGVGSFYGLIWWQYFIQSPAAISFGIADKVPTWVIPKANSYAITHRTFLNKDFIIPILLIIGQEILGRMSWMGLGYSLFRITSDVERLPFPMAPVAAAGATALAESNMKEESWRWQIFSTGTIIGLVYGFFYVAIPGFTGTILPNPVQIIPIPFIDLTRNTQNILPGALTGISGDLSYILAGFVIPFPIVAGTFISSFLTKIALPPYLYYHGLIPDYKLNMGTLQADLVQSFNFFLSLGIGVGIAVGIIGIAAVIKTLKTSGIFSKKQKIPTPKGRGDVNILWAIGFWFAATVGYVALCYVLVPKFPWWITAFFGFLWTPLTSYVSARMVGLTGQAFGFPMVKEASFVLSGYRGVDIWFAPIPLADYGVFAQKFREVELTRTKFTSVIKAEFLILPVVLVCSFIFWAFLWKMQPIPSAAHPFAYQMWPLQATSQALWFTANQGHSSFLMQALKWKMILAGGVGALAVYGGLALFKVPVLWFYGLVAGVGYLPHYALPTFIGALLGKYYFAKRFGKETWNAYAPVLMAGYFCGTGLMAMVAIALGLIIKSTSFLPF